MLKAAYFLLLIFVTLYHAYAQAEQKFSFATGAGAMAGTLNIAESKGFFGEHGIDAQIDTYKNGKIAFDNFIQGKNDFTVSGNLGIVLTDFDITQYRLIATAAYTDNQLKIITRKNASINKTSDLKGKTVAIPKGTSSHFFMCRILEIRGLSCNDINLVYLKKSEMAAALSKEEIDAFCTHGKPVREAKAALGDELLIVREDSVHRKSVQMVTRLSALEDKPELVRGVLRAVIKGEEYVKSHTDESIEIIAKAKKYPIADMDKTVREEMDYRISIEQSLLLHLETIEQWAIDNRLVDRTTPRNYMQFIDFRPLNDVAPQRVTLIK